MGVSVRRIEEGDLERLIQLRLAALADAPGAFLARLEDERAMDEAAWRRRLESNVEGVRTVGFFVVVDGRERGLVVGVRPEGEPEVVDLNAMWVAPDARGRGAGRALVEAVCEWGRAVGCTRATLCVIDGNREAAALYRACGFVETRRCEEDHVVGRTQILMARALDGR